MKRQNVETSKRQGRNPEAKVIHALCGWFDREARELPWRSKRRRTGYGALVAETMLQQTQVSRVIGYYRRFMRRFPTVRSLAAADEQEVLALWQGLGYYRRARHLHHAAKMIVSEFGGRVPSTVDELRRLPGVGRYTAGAIASIVHDKPEAIVDGNVHRVLARLFARRGSFHNAIEVVWAWTVAERLVVQATRPGVFNEALMELGAVVCTPKSPKCGMCPVAKLCAARRLNWQDRIPAAAIRAKPQTAHHHAVIITRNGKMLVEQRDHSGGWAGMWQTPTVESDRKLDLIEVKRSVSADVGELLELGGFDHHTTHRKIRFHVYRTTRAPRKRASCRRIVANGAVSSQRRLWRSKSDLAILPMSNAQRRVLEIAAGQQSKGIKLMKRNSKT